MSFVIDASIVVAWAFEEVAPAANEARERLRHETAIAPGVWWFEVRNALVQGERRGRFSELAGREGLPLATLDAALACAAAAEGTPLIDG